MASRSLGTLTLDLIAKTGGFVAGMDAAERRSQKWRKQVEKDAKMAGKALAAAAVAAGAGLTALVAAQIKEADQARKTAQAIGVSTEAYTALSFAASQSGISQTQLSSGLGRLNRSILEASEGVATYVDAFSALGISVKNADGTLRTAESVLGGLAERFSVMPDGVEKSARAMELLGRSGAAMIPMLNSGADGIEALVGQAEALGLVISDKTAREAELFNDSLAVMASVSTGLGRQIAANLLPQLSVLAGQMADSATESGALAVMAENVAEAIRAVAAVVVGAVGAMSLLKTTAEGTWDTLSQGDNALERLASITPPALLYRAVTGGFEDTAEKASAAVDDLDQTAQRYASLINTITNPPPSSQTQSAEQRIKDIRQMLDGFRSDLEKGGSAGSPLKPVSDDLKRIEVFSRRAKVSDFMKEQIKLQSDHNELVRELQTEEERLQAQLNKRLDLLDKITFISDEARNETLSRVVSSSFTKAPEYSGLAPEIGGTFSEFTKINAAQSDLDEWYSSELERLAEYRAQRADMAVHWDEQEAKLAQQHADRLSAIEEARRQTSLVAAEDLFGSMASLTKQFAGEQSAAYKVMFAAEKAAAIARSIVAIQAGIAQAANNPWPANIAAMASVAASTASIISTITSTNIGQAHDGMARVPKTGSYILEQGERVVPAETTARMDATLRDIQSSREQAQSSGDIRIVNSFDSDEVVGGYLGSASGDREVMNIVRKNRNTIRSLAS